MTVFVDPQRPKPRIRPMTALRRMGKLIQDKEDTEQVFHIIDALAGRAPLRDLEAFAKTEKGAARLAERQHLPPLLDDHSWIKDLPEGTVGRAYIEFMEREGLTAQGLVDESEKFRATIQQFNDDLGWYANRLRDTHDLFHVLTGYGRDALGEASLLAFTYSLNKSPGIMFMAYVGGREIRKHAPKEAPVMAAIWEGKRHGQMANRIHAEDIIALLKEDLKAARARLNIGYPEKYREALEVFRAHGDDPILLAA